MSCLLELPMDTIPEFRSLHFSRYSFLYAGRVGKGMVYRCLDNQKEEFIQVYASPEAVEPVALLKHVTDLRSKFESLLAGMPYIFCEFFPAVGVLRESHVSWSFCNITSIEPILMFAIFLIDELINLSRMGLPKGGTRHNVLVLRCNMFIVADTCMQKIGPIAQAEPSNASISPSGQGPTTAPPFGEQDAEDPGDREKKDIVVLGEVLSAMLDDCAACTEDCSQLSVFEDLRSITLECLSDRPHSSCRNLMSLKSSLLHLYSVVFNRRLSHQIPATLRSWQMLKDADDLSKDRRCDEATAFLDAARALGIDNAFLHNQRGINYAFQERLREAVAEFEIAVTMQPGIDVFHENLGKAYMKVGDFQNSLKELKEALLLNNDSIDVHRALAHVYQKQAMLDLSLWEFNQVLQLNPRDGMAHFNIALMCERLRRFEDAAAHYEMLLSAMPELPPEMSQEVRQVVDGLRQMK